MSDNADLAATFRDTRDVAVNTRAKMYAEQGTVIWNVNFQLLAFLQRGRCVSFVIDFLRDSFVRHTSIKRQSTVL